MNVSALIKANAARWAKAKVQRNFDFVAQRLVNAKSRYLPVQRKTGVPWFVIAVIHERECSQSWDRSIAQGDPWNTASIHVPKGRGPFQSWEDAAYDALMNCSPYAADWNDWTAGGALTLLEQYNGLGYYFRGMPSPYIWSGTDQYVSGKFVADNIFRADVVDSQLGCAGLLIAMQKLDPTIRFSDEVMPPPDIEPVHPKKPKPHVIAGGAVAGGVVAASQVSSHIVAGIIIGVAIAVAAIIIWKKRS